MFTVYALHSPNYKKIYIGYSSDLESRLLSHNKLGKKGWTIKYRPWEVVHTEECETKAEA
ncbi:MAG TPA: GIY-YIG nuclease family protein, partial [Balneolaceae bacterium]